MYPVALDGHYLEQSPFCFQKSFPRGSENGGGAAYRTTNPARIRGGAETPVYHTTRGCALHRGISSSYYPSDSHEHLPSQTPTSRSLLLAAMLTSDDIN